MTSQPTTPNLSERISSRRGQPRSISRILGTVLVGITVASLMTGCLPADAERDNHSNEQKRMSALLDNAIDVEKALASGQASPTSDRVASLCSQVNAGVSPEQWRATAMDIGGKYATIVETTVALNEWSKMRCGR